MAEMTNNFHKGIIFDDKSQFKGFLLVEVAISMIHKYSRFKNWVVQVNYKNGRIAVQPTRASHIYQELKNGLYDKKAVRERKLLYSRVLKTSYVDLSSKNAKKFGTMKGLKITVDV